MHMQNWLIPLTFSEPTPTLKPWKDSQNIIVFIFKDHKFSTLRLNLGFNTQISSSFDQILVLDMSYAMIYFIAIFNFANHFFIDFSLLFQKVRGELHILKPSNFDSQCFFLGKFSMCWQSSI